MAQLWQGETEKAIENFPISGERVPVEVVRMLARVKAEAARVNAELGLLDAGRAERIAAAAEAVAAGTTTTSSRSTCSRPGRARTPTPTSTRSCPAWPAEGVHPNDHVNMCQSSNDTFPTAVHLAALDAAVRPAAGAGHAGRVAAGQGGRVPRRREARAHPPDGRRPGHPRPEFDGYAAQVTEAARAGHDALVGSQAAPRRHRGRHRAQRPPRVRGQVRRAPRRRHRPRSVAARPTSPPRPPVTGWSSCPGRPRRWRWRCTKIANDIRWMGSGPRTGLGELACPSSCSPAPRSCRARSTRSSARSVTQVSAQVIGNDTAIASAA